jgi:hypothetical protein
LSAQSGFTLPGRFRFCKPQPFDKHESIPSDSS